MILYVIGKNSDTLKNLSFQYNKIVKKVDYLKNAVTEINNDYIANNNSVAILSPAAASLDQFSSYKERGEKFKEFINSIIN